MGAREGMISRLVFSGGTVLDGSGSPGRRMDVLVADGVICGFASSGERDGGIWQDATRLDCRGKFIAPGFVDIHCHSDLSLFQYPSNESRVTQGITTEVLGNCGMTPAAPAPIRQESLSSVIGTINVVPEFEWPWNDLRGWLDALTDMPTATNSAALIGHSTVRFAVSGPRSDSLDHAQLRSLERQLEEAIDMGCVGISLGLMYPPGEGADSLELTTIGKIAAKRDVVLTAHMRSYTGAGLVASVDEMISVAERTGARVQISHLRSVGAGARYLDSIEHIDFARRSMDIAADCYPYIAGHTNLIQLFPPSLRGSGAAKLTDFCRQNPIAAAHALQSSGFNANGVTIMKAASNAELIGKTADSLGKDPWRELVTLLADNDCLVDVAVVGSEWADVRVALSQPWMAIASDGTALSRQHSASLPHPRSWGAFPRALRMMMDMGIPIEEGIRKVTVLPASRAGLDSGIERGRPANLVVFDPDELKDRADYGDPAQAADGIQFVVVNGEIVLNTGAKTSAMPGRFLSRR